jgi:hypothetical protein
VLRRPLRRRARRRPPAGDRRMQRAAGDAGGDAGRDVRRALRLGRQHRLRGDDRAQLRARPGALLARGVRRGRMVRARVPGLGRLRPLAANDGGRLRGDHNPRAARRLSPAPRRPVARPPPHGRRHAGRPSARAGARSADGAPAARRPGARAPLPCPARARACLRGAFRTPPATRRRPRRPGGAVWAGRVCPGPRALAGMGHGERASACSNPP